MDYQKVYTSLISKRTATPLKKSKELYTELHHIVPRCLGGSDERENLVRLTCREHFIAHRLLAKIHPDSEGLNLALLLMLTGRDGVVLASSRQVEELRRSVSRFAKARWTDELKREVSERMSGEGNRCFGKFKEAHPAFGHVKSQEFKENASKVFKNYWADPANYRMLCERSKVFWNKPENKKLAAECKRGERNPNYGKNISGTLTTEQLLLRNKRVSAGHKNRFPPEHYEVYSHKHEFWEKADLLAFHLKLNNWKLSADILMKVYGRKDIEAWNSTATITRRIESGWEPLEDPRWVRYTEERISEGKTSRQGQHRKVGEQRQSSSDEKLW